ncbi:MAG: radical SAM protein [Theionarchaea archaeon]|nr:radical SAM protein [Theionarchaea archaeon]
MRLALIFPPSMPPTSPPCGIAYLKAFRGSGKTFDLNLGYHDTAVHMLNKGELPLDITVGRKVAEPEKLKEAVLFLKGNKDFYDSKEYNRNVAIFFDYFSELYSYIQKESMNYLEGSPNDAALSLFEKVLSPVKRYHPDVVGFSQMVLPQREVGLALAQYLKTEDISLVLGGASLWYNPESYLSRIGHVDLSHLFDAVFYGEGELPLKAYIDGENLEKIPNIVYKKDKIIKNEETGFPNLDALPCPDFGDFSLKEYYAPEIILPLLTSRGCYWRKCTFCTHYRSYYTYRARSVRKVVSDLRELHKRYNASYFLLADEMVHPRRFNELSEGIIREGLNIRVYSEAKPTKDFTSRLLKKMYASGVRALLWGVESGTQRILDLMDKGTTVKDIEQVLHNSHTAGIWNMVFMIVEYPTQTRKEIEEDIAFLQKNAPYMSTVTGSLFKLEVGSRMYEHPEKFGIKKVQPADVFSPVCQYSLFEELPEADLLYKVYSVEFVVLSRVSWYFGKMRDHMLLFADKMSDNPLKYEKQVREWSR